MRTPIRSGMTLLEVVISFAIVASIMHMVTQALYTGARAQEVLTMRTEMSDSAHQVLNRLAIDLRGADHHYSYITEVDTATGDELRVWTFNVCGGFASDGEAEYTVGEYGREVIYNVTQGTLEMTYIEDDGTEATSQVARHVNDFAVSPISGDLLAGNTITMNLTIERTDSQNVVHDNSAERMVLLRSTIYHTDGLTSADGSQTNPADTADDTLEPEMITGPGVEAIWGNDQDRKTNKVRIDVSLIENTGYRIDPSSVNWQTSADLSVKYNATRLELTFTGAVTGPCDITITADSIHTATGATVSDTFRNNY
ncbi:MAG: PulJ/GspJ family protein [Planctomycetota bacterium]